MTLIVLYFSLSICDSVLPTDERKWNQNVRYQMDFAHSSQSTFESPAYASQSAEPFADWSPPAQPSCYWLPRADQAVVLAGGSVLAAANQRRIPLTAIGCRTFKGALYWISKVHSMQYTLISASAHLQYLQHIDMYR